MANIVISEVCNLKCPYCFARQFLENARTHTDSIFISPEDFEARLDFLDASGIHEVRLIGGEPTLHPRFTEMVERARERGKSIVVFSHGLMSERALACLETLPPGDCTVLVNINATRHRDQPDEREMTQRRSTIARLGQRVQLGFNIYSPRFQLDFLLPLIEETGCQRAIRVGLAQPILDGQNAYLHPKQYPVVASRLVRFAQNAMARGIRLDFDCGFVRCMFSEADLKVLEQAGTPFEAHCNPILDLAITGEAIHCFPLTGKVELPAGSGMDAGQMRERLSRQTHVYRSAGIYKECSTCLHKQNGVCSGGCLAVTLRRFQHTAIRLDVPTSILSTPSQGKAISPR